MSAIMSAPPKSDVAGSAHPAYHTLKAGTMASLSWGDPTRAPEIVFLHANGFNARAYSTLLAPLGERFRVLAPDLRGHGRTGLPAKLFGYSSWNRHRDDVIELIKTHIRAPVTLAGHSLGAIVALLVAGKRPDLVRGVAMIEPVFLPEAALSVLKAPGGVLLGGAVNRWARMARRRRATFETRAAAIEGLSGRGVFASLPPQAIADFVEDGLVEAATGGFQLACSPHFEARTYVAQRHDPWRALVRAPSPIIALRGDKASTFGAAAAKRVALLRPEARVATVEGASHMLPFERPDRARAAIEAAAMAAHARPRDLD